MWYNCNRHPKREKMKLILVWAITIILQLSTIRSLPYEVEDIFVPSDCTVIAKSGDHLLIEYQIIFNNATIGPRIKQPDQLYHVLLETSDELPVQKSMKGVCKNTTRKITWKDASKMNPNPVILPSMRLNNPTEPISTEITVIHITEPMDYQIFDALHQKNMTLALDIIDAHHGINAVDEWGQTALIISVSMNYLAVVSSLLNTRRPKVDVNIAKSSGFTAVFYAVERSTPDILQALLRRGGDPNLSAFQKGSAGNTPLHYACLLEKAKHAELLLEYGANPYAINEHGQTPLNLLPRDAVPSIRLYFKKMFESARAKLQSSLSSSSSIEIETRQSMNNVQPDL